MSALGFVFDATAVAPDAPRDVIPAGDYTVQIINSEMKPTKKGDGAFLWLELEILDGPHARQHLFDRLNLQNPNPTAQDIAQRALSAICHAIGKLQVSDSEQLHFQPLRAKVKVKPADGQYGASNEIGGYSPANGSRPATVATTAPRAVVQQSAPAAAAAAVTGGGGAKTPPWRQRAAAAA